MNTKTEVLIGFAEMCGERLTDSRMKAYLFALKDLSLEELRTGAYKLMNDPSLTRFPMPGKIIEAARPSISTDDEAKEAAGRIVAAISKFGYPNRLEAKKYIGELGWRVVEMQGGWGHLCESTRDQQIPSLQAQFRELAKSQHKKAQLGRLDEAPSLPGSDSSLTGILKIKGVGE